MSTPPPAMELTFRKERRSRRVLCMRHLTVGGSIYFSAERSEVGKRDCRGINAENRVAPDGASSWMQGAPAQTGGAKLSRISGANPKTRSVEAIGRGVLESAARHADAV